MKTILYISTALMICTTQLFGQSNKNAGNNFKNPFNQKSPTQRSNVLKPAGQISMSKKQSTYQKNNNSYSFDLTNSRSAYKQNSQSINKENFFQLYSEELKMKEGDDSFSLTNSQKDELGFTHRIYKQTYKNISVEGSGFVLHEKNGTIQRANGNFFNGLNINTTPIIAEQNAIQKAQQALVGTGYSNTTPILVIAPKNGIYQSENFRLCYKVKVTTEKPYQIYDVFIDAHTGEIVNKISKIATGDVVGSGNTLYSGTKSFTADSYSGSFRLRETGRPIQTFDMQNGTNYPSAVDFTDNNNNWIEQSDILESITVSAISSSWWYNSVADQTPDLYLIVKDGSNSIALQTNYISNTNPPLTFNNLKLQLTNPPYTFELWDYDAVGSDDFGGTYSISLNLGTNSFSGSGNNGSYLISGQNNPALDIHWGMEKTYDYYLNEHSRNSFDNAGSTIKNYVHYDNAMNNAFWDGQAMSYGDGDGSEMSSVVGLDVVGHEFTHAVVENNGGGGLNYQGESGALNESFADIFGTAIEFYGNPSSGDWTIGEDVMVSSAYLRSMSNPNSENQPDTYDGSMWVDPTNLSYDHGGVHVNSGVQNFWFYLLSQGGSGTNDKGNSYSVIGIGINKAKQIAYRNLTTYLIASTNSTYLDAYDGSIKAAEDLYGNGSAEYWAVIDAWYAVGIGSTSTGYCGGTTEFNTSSDSFTDGSGNANYQDNSNCKWLIKPTGANSITLNFTSFDTEAGYDSVVVYDGEDTLSAVLMVWWGNTLPPPVSSSGGAMLVQFLSDNVTTATGWAANYTSTGTAYCNGLTVLSTASGSLTDGSGSNNYGNNSECYWYISPPGATSVTLSFSAFNTELNYDGIAVYDDINGTNLLGTYSGTSLPSQVTSNTGEMLVVFVSDYITTAPGFSASYTSVGTPYCSGTTNLTTDYATINDGSGTNNYYNNSNCNKLIQPVGATAITLIFTAFDLEQPSSDGKTIYDYVEVYDGANTSAPSLGIFSGSNIPPSVTSTGGSMYIKFVSDYSVNEGGWDAYYLSETNTYCTSTTTTLTAVSGTVTDGSGANQYGNNSDCSWLIKPTNATAITLTFTSFNTELNYDGVIVYDGNDTTANVLGTFTGVTIPSPVTSTGGSMFLWFLSDEAIRGNGWSANYNSAITGIEAGSILNSFSIHPNPNQGNFIIELDTEIPQNVELKIFDITGRMVFSEQLSDIKGGYKKQVDLSSYSKGIYNLQLRSDGGMLNEKIIIE